MTLHPAVIGLQCKEEGRDPDGQGADKGQLQGQKGIREARKQTDQGEQQGENIFETDNIEDTLITLLGGLKQKKIHVSDIKVDRGTLEQHFIELARRDA